MKDLVSFCLKAYNQKKFIGEAFDGAVAQTYRPLEIVVCDDRSTDGTWELLVEKAAAWRRTNRDPDVTLVLHRNETNLGNCKNWERCGELAHGELLIKADGDDVSLPERTARVAAAWAKAGKAANVVSHGCEVVDTHGRKIGVRNDADVRHPLGACMAWSRDCFAGWPEIRARFAYDDIVFSVRARLLGGEIVLPDRLVRYRVGSGETSVAGIPRAVDASVPRISRRDSAMPSRPGVGAEEGSPGRPRTWRRA